MKFYKKMLNNHYKSKIFHILIINMVYLTKHFMKIKN